MELKDKTKFALDEARILVLGGQVLIGFGYQSVFQPGFQKLPSLSQDVLLGSVLLMVAGLAVVMSPAARDCLFEKGEPSAAFHRFTTRMVDVGLLPFAVGLGVSLGVAARITDGAAIAFAAGIVATLLALCFWYGLRLIASPNPASAANPPSEKGAPVELKDKINHALTETRMVLPGVQAMLGFQFIAMLTESFERLPASSKYIHVACLGMTALTIIFLITPAAFHRIVERGEATERQHRVTTKFLLAAMATLPPGVTGDLFVIVAKATGSRPFAIGAAMGMLTLFYGLWFGIGLALRSRRREIV